jgi:hypothetical protein
MKYIVRVVKECERVGAIIEREGRVLSRLVLEVRLDRIEQIGFERLGRPMSSQRKSRQVSRCRVYTR